jgi:hypothetical protein
MSNHDHLIGAPDGVVAKGVGDGLIETLAEGEQHEPGCWGVESVVEADVGKLTAEVTVQVGAFPFLGGLAWQARGLVNDHHSFILKAHLNLEFWGPCCSGLKANYRSNRDGLAGETGSLSIDADPTTLNELAGTFSAELSVICNDLVESARFGGGELCSHGWVLACWTDQSPGPNRTIMDIPFLDELFLSVVQ